MKVVSNTDFDKTLNLPKKTIDTEDEIVKKDSFFLESFQDGNKFNIANEKNIHNKCNVNISEIPMPISDKIPPTTIINKVLKDVIARYSILKGNYINHSIGFFHTDEMLKQAKDEDSIKDENKDEKNTNSKLSSSKNSINKSLNFSHVRKEFGIVEKNKATLESNIRKQIYEISNLGTMINYSKYHYSTMKLDVNNQMLEKFASLYKNGSIYSEKKPVHWCTNCGKSIHQKDIKYRKSKVKNTYFLCKIKNDNGNFTDIVDLKNTFLICTTLRPWTLLNTNKLIVAKNTKFSVVKVEDTKNTITYYIVESKHVKHVMEDAFYIKYDIIKEFDSDLFNNVIAISPIKNDKNIPIYIVDKKYVNIDDKNITGINLIGNSDSYLDHMINKELNITEKLNCVIDAKGNFNNFIPEYKGKNYKDVNEEVISLLKKEKMLFLDTNTVIVIPRCKICNNEATYRYLNKWYVKRNEDIANELKLSFENLEKRIIYNIEDNSAKIKKGLNKILNTHDLSISNERKSSVPVPAFYCANCGHEIISDLTIDICKNILKEKGIDTWNKMTPEDILQGQVKCQNCDCDFLFKDDNSLNDWFKLLTIPMFNVSIENNNKLKKSESNGNDEQNSVNSILTKNYCIETRNDFLKKLKVMSFDTDAVSKINSINHVILHTKVKENTKTIAKPLFFKDTDNDFSSNLITTNLGIIDIVKKYGIDVLRLWAVYRSDSPSIRLTEGDIINVKTSYIQFRKTLKYILSNLYDFNPTKDTIKVQERDDLDIYIYSKMQQLESVLDRKYNELNFPLIYKTLYKFCVEILENNYFEAIKYKLYITPKNGYYRRSVQSNLYDLIGIFVTYLQPILPLLFEECWPHIYHNSPEEERNILLFRDTNDLEKLELTAEQKDWHKIFILRKKIIPLVNKACNDGIIKNSLEARVIITCSEFDYNFIKNNYYDIIRTLNVSVIVFKIGETLNIEVKKALGVACHKCKNYSTAIGINYKYRHLCKFCANIEESIITNNVSKTKPEKDIYIDSEHINDDDENEKIDINIPPPPKFETINLDNIEFDDRLGDTLDEEKIKKIKELSINSPDNILKKDINENVDNDIPQYHFENEFESIDENLSNENNNDIEKTEEEEETVNNTNIHIQEVNDNFSNIEFDDRLGDSIDDEKINKIKELNNKTLETKENVSSNLNNNPSIEVESKDSKDKLVSSNTQSEKAKIIDTSTTTDTLANNEDTANISTHEFDDRLGDTKKLNNELKSEEAYDSDSINSNNNVDLSTKLQTKIENENNNENNTKLQNFNSSITIEKTNDKLVNNVNNVDNTSSGFWDDIDNKKKSNDGFFNSIFKKKIHKENLEETSTKKDNINDMENNIKNNDIENKPENSNFIKSPHSESKDIAENLNESNLSNLITITDNNKVRNNDNDNNNNNSSTSDNTSFGEFEDSFRD